jgi:predicted ABC-type ATPase
MKFKDFLFEQKEKHAVLAFGRMNPITSGHEKLVNKVKDVAREVGGSHHIVLSHSQDARKNPLSATQKVKHAKRAFPGTNFSASSSESPNFLTQAADLHKKGVTHLHVVGGSDRVKEFHDTLHRYNGSGEGKLFNFKKITVHSAGERDPDAEGVSGMSASKMRGHAQSGNFNEFKKGVPSSMSHPHAKELYNDVRKGMRINEDIDEDFSELLTEGVNDKSIFKAVFLAGGPGSGKDYVLDNTLEGHGLTEINSDKALEFLMDKEGLDKTMPEDEKEARNFVRDRAKNITELRQRLALQGRNGLIINGTGDDYKKIERIKSALENLGYDTSMIMVNTSDEVSAARNVERGQRGGRTVPEDIRRQKWESVQNSRPELAKLFGDQYKEFDNSEDLRTADPEVVKQKKDEMMELYKNIQDFVGQPPSNPKAQEWVAQEMQKADRLPVPTDGAEQTPHPDSNAAQEARQLGLQYYGFGRYGRNGKVTHRSVHDKLVEVDKQEQEKESKTNSSLNKKDSEFNGIFKEELSLDEDLRNWFSKTHPKGDWVRMSSTGEIKGPCAREPGEPKPKCLARARAHSLSKKERAAAVRAKRRADPDAERTGKPINVRVPADVKKESVNESYDLSDSSSLNLLLLGNRISEVDYQAFGEEKQMKLYKDKNGKIRTFMLRSAAAKEAHTKNGTVIPYKNGYAIKLNEENDNVDISKRTVRNWIEENRESPTRRVSEGTSGESRGLLTEGIADLTTGQEYAKGTGIEITPTTTQETGPRTKITLGQIRQRKKETQSESIDKGIEPGLSMATSGENLTRPSNVKNKQVKKPFEEAIGAGGEMATSMSDYNDNVLKQKGINIKTFKAKRPIG